MTVTIDIFAFGKFIIAALIVALVVGILMLAWKKVRRFIISRRYDVSDRKNLRARWVEIEAMLEKPGDMHLKLAVLEADKLLDHSLKALSFSGKGLGDRLKFAQYRHPKLRNVWWAHKIRNQIAHEASFHLDRGTAKRAIKEFKKALILIGAI